MASGGPYNGRVKGLQTPRAECSPSGSEGFVSDAYSTKLQRLRGLMQQQGYDAVVLSRVDNLFWLAGADTHVGLNADCGIASAVVARDRVTVVTSNIERPRLIDEEFARVGIAVEAVNWWDGSAARRIAELTDGDGAVAADTAMAGYALVDVAPLRYELVPEEVAAYRRLGTDMGEAVGQVAREFARGESEFQLAGRLSGRLLERAITPVVVLVAADDRIARYRHPIPTTKTVDDLAMLVACGRREGLIVALTRLVKFSAVPAELARRHQAVCQVDAAFIAATVPGTVVSTIWAAGVQAYRDAGFADEWQLHHQGGATGYAGRDYKATATCNEVVRSWQAFAWNPSITGTKSEDTMLATPDGPEIISASPDWPLLQTEAAGRRFGRPDILVR